MNDACVRLTGFFDRPADPAIIPFPVAYPPSVVLLLVGSYGLVDFDEDEGMQNGMVLMRVGSRRGCRFVVVVMLGVYVARQ